MHKIRLNHSPATATVYYEYYYLTGGLGDSELEDLPKSGELARAAPPDAHDAQLSNGPIGASIRVREGPIQQCQRLTSLTAAHSFGVESQARARSR